jgi:multidrug resistance efflux pump
VPDDTPAPWTYPGSDNPGTIAAGRLVVWLMAAAVVVWVCWGYAHRDTSTHDARMRAAFRQ